MDVDNFLCFTREVRRVLQDAQSNTTQDDIGTGPRGVCRRGAAQNAVRLRQRREKLAVRGRGADDPSNLPEPGD